MPGLQVDGVGDEKQLEQGWENLMGVSISLKVEVGKCQEAETFPRVNVQT